MIEIKIKPLSVNKVWQGRRFKTNDYRKYEKELLSLLPKQTIKGQLKVNVIFGFSSKLSDIDNPLKPFLDVLCKKYNFDDRQIFELNVKKDIVKKGSEFIKYKIQTIK